MECDKALQLRPGSAECVRKRGEAYCLLHLYEQGLADLRKYLNARPSDVKMTRAYSFYFQKASG